MFLADNRLAGEGLRNRIPDQGFGFPVDAADRVGHALGTDIGDGQR